MMAKVPQLEPMEKAMKADSMNKSGKSSESGIASRASCAT